MKQFKLLFYTIFLLLMTSSCLFASDRSSDSLNILSIVNEFYNWYLTDINNSKSKTYKPVFVEDNQGMTTLDFSKYTETLKYYNFSNPLIEKVINSYGECIEQLSKVRFVDFRKTKFIDLDEYESAKCDFGNTFKWCCGLEPVNGIEIINIKFIDGKSSLVNVKTFDYDSNKSNKKYLGNIKIRMVAENHQWYIDDIKLQ